MSELVIESGAGRQHEQNNLVGKECTTKPSMYPDHNLN